MAKGASAPATVTVLDLPSTAGNYASTPDSVANSSLSTDFDIRAKVAADDWTPSDASAGFAGVSSVVGKFASQFSWIFGIASDATFNGCLYFGRSTNGSNFTTVKSSVVTGFADGTTNWIRVTRATSTVTFYTSADGSSWTQLGTTQTLSGTIFDSTAAVQIGEHPSLGAGYAKFAGLVYYVELRSSVAGTVVAKYDPSAVTILGTRNPTTVVASTGETWTMNGSAWDWVTV